MVGFLASWWMCIPIGLLVGAAGFFHRDYRRMFKVSVWSFGVVVPFTLLFGLCGLFYGYLQTTTIKVAEYRGWFIPDDVVNLRRFLCAGYMHNSSYLGGVLAIVAAWILHSPKHTRRRATSRPHLRAAVELAQQLAMPKSRTPATGSGLGQPRRHGP